MPLSADRIPAGAVEGVGMRARLRTRFADTAVPIASAPPSVSGDDEAHAGIDFAKTLPPVSEARAPPGRRV